MEEGIALIIKGMGPLAGTWATMQEAANEMAGRVDDNVADELKGVTEIIGNLNATIAHIGQGLQKLAHERRLNIMAALSSLETAKARLVQGEKDISADESDQLFGEKFAESLAANNKEIASFKKALVNKGKKDGNSSGLYKKRTGTSHLTQRHFPYKKQPYKKPFQQRSNANYSSGGGAYYKGGASFNSKGKLPFFSPLKHRESVEDSEKNFSRGNHSQGAFSRGKIKSTFEKLGSADPGSANPKHSKGIHYPFLRPTSGSIKRTTRVRFFRSGVLGDTNRNRRNVDFKSHFIGRSFATTIRKLNLCETQKRGKKGKTHPKFENFEQRCLLSKIQDGISYRDKEFSQKRTMVCEDRSKIGLPSHSDYGISEETAAFQMERKIISNGSASFRLGFRSSDFHKTDESSNRPLKEIGDSSGNLFGRHAFNGRLLRTSRRGQGRYNVPTRNTRSISEPQEKHVRTIKDC